MLKRFIVFLCLVIASSVFAGELENALKQNKNVFLYFYTPDCWYCKKFSTNYTKLSQTYDKQYKFIKFDASTPYGYNLFKKYKGKYVPYIVLINSKNNAAQVDPNCLVNTVCAEKALTKFIK